MPIIALVGAGIAWASAAGAVGGLLAGTGLTLMGALTITAAVGATVGAIGVITRDKGLQTAGMILGGIGAVGALAAGVSGLGSTQLFGTASTTGSAAGSVTKLAQSSSEELDALNIPDHVDITGPVLRGASVVPKPGPNIDDVIDQLYQPPGNAPAEQRFAADTTNMTDANVDTRPDAATSTDVAPKYMSQPGQDRYNLDTTKTGAAANVAPWDAPKTDVTGSIYDQTHVLKESGLTVPGPAEADTSGQTGIPFLDKFLNFAQKNQYVTNGLFQMIGGLADGFSPLKKEQAKLYDAQAANNRAAAAFTNQEVSNMQGGMPVATLGAKPTPVTGRPAPTISPTYQAQATGMINQPQPVTGAPA